MGIREGDVQLVSGAACQIDSEDGQEVRKRRTVDNTQTKEFIDTGNRILVFELRKPRVRNVIFLVAGSLRKLPAEFFDFPGRNAEVVAQLSELISGTWSAGHGIVSILNGRLHFASLKRFVK
jgi:hypothetical protein